MDADKANDQGAPNDSQAAESAAVVDEAAWAALTKQIERIVDDDYDLGRVVRAERIFGGYVNASFAVWTRTESGEHRYFVRKYNQAITEREVRFEHALLTHLASHGFDLASSVFPNRHGESFVTREELVNGEPVTTFFGVFRLLAGEDKYTWVKNRLTDKEYDSGARVLAQFHHSAFDFDPGDLAREQPPIMEFVPTLADTFTKCATRATGTAFDDFFLGKLPAILDVIAKGVEVETQLAGLPVTPVHCDYHPGNLKWADEQGVGLFDFDWSKLDYRVFDVAQGVAYFCSSWEGPDRGELRLDKAAVFVRAYQDEAARWADPGPMSARELAVLPRMIANANLFILNWDVTFYYAETDPDVDEYMVYLTENVGLMEFIEDHFEELAHIAE
ncbi:MAG: phosphotransferase [Actinobacteria bacterium]|nr:phosphotransferase [Actinomycetota bacterium]